MPFTSDPFDSDTFYTPVEALSLYNGENAIGFWTLEIVDNSAANDGFLNNWSLSIVGDELSTVTDGTGNYSFARLVPGIYDVAAVEPAGWSPTETHPTLLVATGQIQM